MKELQNKTLQEFINRFVEVLKEENEEREEYNKRKLDIPYVLSSLYQSFYRLEFRYRDFIKDLEEWSDYGFIIYKSQNDYNGIIDVHINLLKYEQSEDDWYSDYNCPDYNYLLTFEHDEQMLGYCECHPGMKDYREDKGCCGHGCDATFCKFSLHKVFDVIKDDWHGDEHDYWEFEDEFYLSDEELNKKKKEEDLANEIQVLTKQIEGAQERLKKLLENIDEEK